MNKSFFRRMFHWGPMLACSIIFCVTTSAVYCHLQWWPVTEFLGCIDIILFLISSTQCLANLFKAAYVGPGYVPLRWKPDNDEDQSKLQYCTICEGFKAPRCHHCRKCDRCVMKMDHHCPWINNCCGYQNQAYFIQFLFWAVIGCLHGCLILGPSIYRALFRVYYLYYGAGNEPIVELTSYGLFYAICAFGMALGVVLAVGFLFVMQTLAASCNKSGIEEYIINKARHRPREDDEKPFIYPYDLGWKRNLREIFFQPINDSFSYPVIEGCNQFTFTIEQLKQKQAKRQFVVEYDVVKPYNGTLFFVCVKFGCKVHFCQPLSENCRLKISPGQTVLVSRWRRHWLYGELCDCEQIEVQPKRKRGWFPRSCVVEPMDSEDACQDNNENIEKCKKD